MLLVPHRRRAAGSGAKLQRTAPMGAGKLPWRLRPCALARCWPWLYRGSFSVCVAAFPAFVSDRAGRNVMERTRPPAVSIGHGRIPLDRAFQMSNVRIFEVSSTQRSSTDDAFTSHCFA